MTEKSRRTSEESKTDALFGVFGGINEGYAAGILDGDSDAGLVRQFSMDPNWISSIKGSSIPPKLRWFMIPR